MVRKHGCALDNLLSADVVIASGQLLKASSTDNPDLFWGIRGGGGNFGIVTSFEFRVHPVAGVLAGLVLHPASRGLEALRFWREYGSTASEDMTDGALFFNAPPELPVPDVLRRVMTLVSLHRRRLSFSHFGHPPGCRSATCRTQSW